jgi:hypothetical protein
MKRNEVGKENRGGSHGSVTILLPMALLRYQQSDSQNRKKGNKNGSVFQGHTRSLNRRILQK